MSSRRVSSTAWARRRWSSSPRSATSRPGATWRSGSSRRASPRHARYRLPNVPRAFRRSLEGMSDDPFVAHRSLLFTVAYEMLGSAADAEDVLQESWLRWADVDQEEVRDPRAYLVQ